MSGKQGIHGKGKGGRAKGKGERIGECIFGPKCLDKYSHCTTLFTFRSFRVQFISIMRTDFGQTGSFVQYMYAHLFNSNVYTNQISAHML